MKKILLPLMAAAALLSQPAIAEEGEALFKTKNCVACHSVDAKLVGPAFKEVAAKYAGQADAADVLAASIKNGQNGKWGPIPMPPNNVTEEQAKVLANWVLQQQ
ncbi:c-type cytochrome [Atopomonas sediminilitoris]|uniref:c-type cytochrome n=1 Tax=Atopomonas sediminilitoris TaxID=2919919 RepID=UPI001F4D588D|nr:c-type cytochrome [Atopomonas sediminilitoris]MCJ8170841.1 c-type cytochrome [Atopomonas sediminilitoris]